MFRHLLIFICVCEESGMTRAAEKLHMTQPSVSQAIRELEEHYGTRLFERLGHRLLITKAGETLLDYAYQLTQLNTQAEKAMQSLREQLAVRIGASVTIGESVLVDLLQTITREMPDQEMLSEIHNTAELETMLLKNELDLALVEGQIQSEYISEISFMTDNLIFIAAPTSKLALKKAVTKDDLEQEKFFIREAGSGTRVLFETVMKKAHIPYQTTGIYNNAESLKKAVEAGLGISVISQRAVQTELHSARLATFDVPGLTFKRTFRIAYHKNKYMTPALKTIIKLCRNLGKK